METNKRKPWPKETMQWLDGQPRLLGLQSLTIGLCSGSRTANDSRAIYRIVKSIADADNYALPSDNRLLLCRLNVVVPTVTWMSQPEVAFEPQIEKSALGNWYQVDISIVASARASEALQKLPHLLPKWKMGFKTIVFDLGPMHLFPSRVIGRLCDLNYVILGPNSCASASWIAQYIAYHEECGAHIAGTINTLLAA